MLAEPHRWDRDRIFNAAWAYDLAFSWDVSRELDVVLRLAGVDEPSGHFLVPACGTGRHAHALAERGFRVEASDICETMLTYARRARPHHRVRYLLADMTRPLAGGVGDCDAAFTFCNSFRYILGEAGVRGHLGAIRARLRPNGIYVIDLGLNSRASSVGARTRWIARHEEREAHACWQLTALTPPTSMEVVEIRVVDSDGTVHVFREEQPQRVWTRQALETMAAEEGFTVLAVVDPVGASVSDVARPGRYYVALQRTSR